jgi:hypothetical protein
MLSVAFGRQSTRVSRRSASSTRSALRKKLFAPPCVGSGTSAMIDAAYGSMRSAGMRLLGNGSPVCGSRTVDVKMPARSSAVGTRVSLETPREMRVPS